MWVWRLVWGNVFNYLVTIDGGYLWRQEDPEYSSDHEQLIWSFAMSVKSPASPRIQLLHPFTPKSDQFQRSHSCLHRWKMIILAIRTTRISHGECSSDYEKENEKHFAKVCSNFHWAHGEIAEKNYLFWEKRWAETPILTGITIICTEDSPLCGSVKTQPMNFQHQS